VTSISIGAAVAEYKGANSNGVTNSEAEARFNAEKVVIFEVGSFKDNGFIGEYPKLKILK